MNDGMKALSGRVGEIVAALLCDGTPESCGKAKKCPYHSKDYNNIGTGYGCDVDRLDADAAGLLKAYASENAQLREQLAGVTAERDAAVEEMNHVCDTCGHDILIEHCHSQVDGECVNWEWRGPQGAGEADHAD